MSAARLDGDALIRRLPQPRGRLEPMRLMSELTWLRVGGPAEVLFTPDDAEDLAAFLAAAPPGIPITPIGVGSNVIVRDGGIPGVVVRLGRGFMSMRAEGMRLTAGAAALDARVAEAAAGAGIAGLAFLRGVPGAIGGAVRMNAGAYGSYAADVFVSAEAVSFTGERRVLARDEMGFAYRDSAPRDLIYVAATLEGRAGDPGEIRAEMAEMMAKREAAQPVKERTAGSTFRNPAGYSSTGQDGDPMGMKAWKLIEAAGARGLQLGAAAMNEKHANFLTNMGGATAWELEALGEEVRRRVKEHSGHELEWEIQRIGIAADV